MLLVPGLGHHVYFETSAVIITKGEPRLTDWQPLAGGEKALALAAAAEYASEHPLARVVVQGAKERGAEVTQPQDFQALSGFGVEAAVESQRVRVGKPE